MNTQSENRTRVCNMTYDKHQTGMMIGDFIDQTRREKAVGNIRAHLRPRISFKIGYIPHTLRRDIPTYWDIHFDGRYIGGFQECFTGITSVFFADDPMRTLPEAKKLSGGDIPRVYCFDEYLWGRKSDGNLDYNDAYYPTFLTLEELVEDFLTRRMNDPDAQRSHKER